ncbi:transglutaminase-like cysteine peptidase [Roseibium aggregatum]|uniref:Transglutaminase-like cysteine peptidase n=1 Tax=Roseibium aggregatum TaxID=187304 RepID=A0A939EE50_9HYPH|nr:transglutaminase-like cysteine peptidase [Roseibium aggregatum]MBN9671089.1 transglutaminase-like cysteine peptidase [Roseibium aggregatum]
MEQSATAPEYPAANRKAVPALWRIGLAALALQASCASSPATEMADAPSDARPLLQISLFHPAPFATHAVEFRFGSPFTAREVRTGLPPSASFAGTEIRSPSAKPVRARRSQETVEWSPGSVGERKSTSLFGALGNPVALTPVSDRWQRALGGLRTGRSLRADFRAYAAILEQAGKSRRGLQIPKVNYMVNRLVAYRQDGRLWQKPEYWASPAETLERRAGDCEDYAILKYALLRDLGIADEDMRIVVLRDTAAKRHHAVLSVRHEGNWLVLDNRFSRVRFERDLPNYRALYSVNAAGAWSHVAQAGNPVRLAARVRPSTE